MRTRQSVKLIVVAIAVLMALTAIPCGSLTGTRTVWAEETAVQKGDGDPLLRENTYATYLDKYGKQPAPDATVTIEAADYKSTDMNVEKKENYEGKSGTSILTAEEGYVEWEIDVPQEGLYSLSIDYYPVAGKSSAIERELVIDGQVPFDEASSIVLSRIWKDVGSVEPDSRGNDIRPEQVESPAWREVVLHDSMGYYNDSLKFYFSKGKHTLRLNSVKEPVIIRSLKLMNEKEIPDYKTVAAEYANKGYKEASNHIVRFQAEDSLYKSDPTLYAMNDRSSPASDPYHPSKVRLNTIGRENWKLPGQWITWEIEVQEDGLYKIGMRARQNVVRGIFTNRKVLIDGKVPFKEMEKVAFKFNDSWDMLVFGDEEPYLFYLEKGKHTLTMENTLGSLAEILREVESSMYELNKAYREILMITGPEPDSYRDYKLDKYLPGVITTFKDESKHLKDVSERLLKYTGQRGSHLAILDRLSEQVGVMAKDADTIPKSFKNFKDNIAALGTWVLTTREQPLDIDYFVVASPEQKMPVAEYGFFAKMMHEIKMFFASFTEDYTTLGTNNLDNKDSVTVWIGSGVTGGRDQAQVLKQMVDNRFTSKTGIPVNIQLINMGALLPATLAGKGPDVALQIGGSEPVNYAMRNAVVDLAQFEDFPEISKRFHQSAIVPYQYLDGVYALPETQSFLMMFYRKDILNELGLKVPETWDDVFQMLPEIQKKHLNFGLPVSMQSYAMLLFQQNGQFYKKDGIASDLDSETAIEAFRMWTDLYVNYKLPLEFSFENRFRVGEIPIGIADYTTYNMLSVFAPEIRGMWDFAPVPGFRNEDGTINRLAPASGAGCIMLSEARNKKNSWEFMKWWTSAETQQQFGRELESIMGAASRYNTANTEALYQLPWPTRDFKSLMSQWESAQGIPEVPGGYFTSRYLDFAFRSVVINGEDSRETLLDYIRIINDEISIKRKEFGLKIN